LFFFFLVIAYDVHIYSSEQLNRTPGNPVSRIYIRHFVDESLCSLRIQYCYRGTYFIDRRSLTRINQRQINRRRAAVRHETNLQSRGGKTLLLDFVSFLSSIPCPLQRWIAHWPIKIRCRNVPVMFHASLFPWTFSLTAEVMIMYRLKYLMLFVIICNSYMCMYMCRVSQFFMQYMKNI